MTKVSIFNSCRYDFPATKVDHSYNNYHQDRTDRSSSFMLTSICLKNLNIGNIWLSSSTTLLAHLFGKIDFFCSFARASRLALARAKQQERIDILPNKCASKVVEELNKSPYFQFADNTFCKTTDETDPWNFWSARGSFLVEDYFLSEQSC